jgi:hypothetical protein
MLEPLAALGLVMALLAGGLVNMGMPRVHSDTAPIS